MKKRIMVGLLIFSNLAFSKILTIDKEYFLVKYDTNLKGAIEITYTLEGSKVNSKNINKRDKFYEEKKIPTIYRTNTKDYTNTGYDRGHVANDASFDWSTKSKNATYSMANIIPQYPGVIRHAWLSVEKQERILAPKYGSIKVINIIEYKDKNKILELMPRDKIKIKKSKMYKNYNLYNNRLKAKKIHIPSGMWKILENKKRNFKICYYVPNSENINKADHNSYKKKCPDSNIDIVDKKVLEIKNILDKLDKETKQKVINKIKGDYYE